MLLKVPTIYHRQGESFSSITCNWNWFNILRETLSNLVLKEFSTSAFYILVIYSGQLAQSEILEIYYRAYEFYHSTFFFLPIHAFSFLWFYLHCEKMYRTEYIWLKAKVEILAEIIIIFVNTMAKRHFVWPYFLLPLLSLFSPGHSPIEAWCSEAWLHVFIVCLQKFWCPCFSSLIILMIK